MLHYPCCLLFMKFIYGCYICFWKLAHQKIDHMITSVADATWSCFYLDVFDVRNCSPSEEPCVFKIVKASHVRRTIDAHNVKVAKKVCKEDP